MLVRILTHMRSQFVGYLALFIALGGTSYAVVKLPAGSVTSREVKNRSLQAVDFKRGQLPRGEQGPAGPQGPPGDPANFDSSLYYTKTDADARYLGKNAKATDADKLDGIDSSGLAQMLYAHVVHDTGSGIVSFTGKGATSVSRTSAGRYTVVFNRSITGCGVTGAPHYRTGASAFSLGRSGSDRVWVIMPEDNDFAVVVVC